MRPAPLLPVLLALSCSRAETGLRSIVAPPRTPMVVVVPESIVVVAHASQRFRATAIDTLNDSLPGPVTWSSADTTVARVDASGLATAVGTGTTAIVATVGSVSGPGKLTVLPPPPPAATPVASVRMAPDTASTPLQGSWPFRATALDSTGAAIPNVVFAWSSADPGIATVDAVGVARAVAPGTTTVTASAGARAASGTLTVLPAGAGNWPNEPAGSSVISDVGWDLLAALGWVTQFGTGALGIDLGAPLSPPSVLQVAYPAGFPGGGAPFTEWFHLGDGVRRLYVGLWWKASDPWQGHDSDVNKIQYVFFPDASDMPMIMFGSPGGPYQLRVIPQFHGQVSDWLKPNVNSVPVTLGTWHRVEWLIVENTTTDPPNGIVRWWLDGLLVGDYTNVVFPAGPIVEYKIAPVWGGVGGTKSETDYFWFDHTHLSGR